MEEQADYFDIRERLRRELYQQREMLGAARNLRLLTINFRDSEEARKRGEESRS